MIVYFKIVTKIILQSLFQNIKSEWAIGKPIASNIKPITILKMGWPKESRDIDYTLWTRLYMFVVEVANPKDGTFHLVTLMSKILVTHLT